ncbi:hypothetical protein EPN95_04515 [Patescibacteria group bacterium]|nr:MAG: hypothetical protein EPN95_04515 [Patescibacteria group bacterium]
MPENKETETTQKGEGVAEETERKEQDPAEKITPDHPRFQEVYGKWKSTERTAEQLKKSLEEKDLDIQLLKQHNQRLETRFSSVEDKMNAKAEEPAPDPIEDPKGYHAWWEKKYDTDRKQVQQAAYAARIGEQIEAQRDLHEDYEAVVKPIIAEMETNQELKNKIWLSANPAREAYKYGKGKMEKQTKENETSETEKEKERSRAIEQGLVEGAGAPPAKKAETKLTQDQARVARLLGVSEEKYLKQLQALEK